MKEIIKNCFDCFWYFATAYAISACIIPPHIAEEFYLFAVNKINLIFK